MGRTSATWTPEQRLHQGEMARAWHAEHPFNGRPALVSPPIGTEDTFGLRLRKLRIAAGLSQARVEAVICSGQSLVSRYEANQRVPPEPTLRAMAELFGVSPDALVALAPVSGSLPRIAVLEARVGALEKLLNTPIPVPAGIKLTG